MLIDLLSEGGVKNYFFNQVWRVIGGISSISISSSSMERLIVNLCVNFVDRSLEIVVSGFVLSISFPPRCWPSDGALTRASSPSPCLNTKSQQPPLLTPKPRLPYNRGGQKLRWWNPDCEALAVTSEAS